MLPDININETSNISFGNSVLGKTGTICTLTVTDYASPGVPANTAPNSISDQLSGDGCIPSVTSTTNNFSGVYAISGIINQSYNITISSASNSYFTFTPLGKVSDITTGVAAGTTVLSNIPQTTSFDAAGTAMLVVGGTITINSELTANTPYNQVFEITATY